MDVDCEGCAGCCLDWRPLVHDAVDGGAGEVAVDGHAGKVAGEADADGGAVARTDSRETLDRERRGRYRPLDDTYNLAPLTRDEVRAFLAAGHAAAMIPRLFRVEDGPSVTVGGVDLAAVGDRPAFLVGLRKVPKPVAPFDADATWLGSCVFLDPETLQCRIHGDDLYPETCATYPSDNLALGAETECERVERVDGGDRLLDDDPPARADPTIGPGAVGMRVFAHPDPARVEGPVRRLVDGEATREDRAEFLAVAAASSPGTVAVSDAHYERARERALDADSWVDDAVAEWTERADAVGVPAPDSRRREDADEAHGAPETPGWGTRDAR